MAAKNVNFFEKNVEKIVLALAVAGAGFLGYMAIQPITIETPAEIKGQVGKEEMGPNDLESAVAAQLDLLEKQQAMLPPPDAKMSNPLTRYNQLAQNLPIPNEVASPPVVAFGPINLRLQVVNNPGNGNEYQIVTPNPVGAEYLHAEARQDQVAAVSMVPGAAAATPGLVVQTRTQNYVTIDGYVPVGKVMLDLLQDKDKAITAQQGIQRAQIYRIAVERTEQTATGWSEWKLVPPTKASPAPTDINFGTMKDGDLPANMDIIDAEFKQIVMPDFYQDALGIAIPAPIMGRPIPPSIVEETKKLQNDIDAAKVPTGFRAAVPLPMDAGGVAATGPAWPADALTLKAMSVVPFTFYDDTVEPNHTYKYRVEVKIVNPTFGWKWGLKNPKMKTEPFLSTGKVVIPQPVTVLSDLVFFISNGIGGSGGVTGVVIKQNNGKWYRGDFSAQPGQKIDSKITLIDEGNKVMDVDTGFTVVDAVSGQGNVHVILKDPTGNLVTRETREDWNRPDRIALFEKVQRPTAATTTSTAPFDSTLLPPPQTGPARGLPPRVNPRTP